jgi:hypothetical protein
MTDVAQIGGLRELWAQTLGDPRICIAILDGPVDLNHPSLREAAIMQINLDEVSDSGVSPHSDHGTHVTSVIFGSHHGPVKGIAPNCRGLIVPIFRYDANGALEPCSQERLAKAIRVAVRFGANVINISGGQFSTRGEASPELLAAIKECGEDVLIVAAAGNDGCDCLHVPGALPSVLAVGAMDAAGRPLPFSNWGEAYREQGILAPGERILGAAGDGGVKAQSGTSFSTPIVSGVAGLLLSLQQKLGIVPRATSIRNAILESTHGCDPQTETQCERVLAGRLNVSGSVSVITRGAKIMSNATNSSTPADAMVSHSNEIRQATSAAVDKVEASACCGGCGSNNMQFVYAIGEIDYDFPSLERVNSLQQSMSSYRSLGRQLNVQDRLDFGRHLCGFREFKIEAASGTLSWDAAHPTATVPAPAPVGSHTGFKLTVASGDVLVAEDDFRCILIRGVRERRKLPDGSWGSWRPWRSNEQQLHIGWIDARTFILRTSAPGHPQLYQYDFSLATWVLPRNCETSPRVHPPHEYDAQSVVWKLRRGSTNVYAVKPGGNYSEAAYGELIDFLLEGQGFERNGLDIYFYETAHGIQTWTAGWDPCFNVRDCCLAGVAGGRQCCTNYERYDVTHFPRRQSRSLERTERVSIPGLIQGQVRVLSGEILTEIAPDMRGTHSWSLARLHTMIEDALRDSANNATISALAGVMSRFDHVLMHLDDIVRNRGLSAQDRALNYAATRIVDILPEIADSLVVPNNNSVTVYELDSVATPVKSEIGPPGSNCWEVEISFFNPDNAFAARVIVSQAIDVSDIIPYRIEKPKQYRRR